jgi:hypothetical protein
MPSIGHGEWGRLACGKTRASRIDEVTIAKDLLVVAKIVFQNVTAIWQSRRRRTPTSLH